LKLTISSATSRGPLTLTTGVLTPIRNSRAALASLRSGRWACQAPRNATAMANASIKANAVCMRASVNVAPGMRIQLASPA
jgi:hypothetical protein